MSRARQLSKTPRIDHEWEVGWVPVGALAPPRQPDSGVLLAVDLSDGLVVGAEVMPSVEPRRMAIKLLQFMLHPATGKPRRPASVRLADTALAAALEAEAGETFEIRIAPLEALESVSTSIIESLLAALPQEAPPLPDNERQAQLFRTAAAFYNARPWSLLSLATPLFVRIEGEHRVAATVTGSTELAPGLALYTDSAAIEALLAGRRVNLGESRSVSLTFVPESRVAPSWRDLRHARRWPIASPSAFPTALTHDHGIVQVPTDDELWLLDATLAAVASLVATHGPTLERGEPFEHSIEVQRPRPAAGRERITVVPLSAIVGPSDRSASPAVQALETVIRAAMSLPDANSTLARLAWSFFRDSGPSHVKPGAETQSAEERFLSWGIFAARVGKQTLAQRGLEGMKAALDPESLAIAKRIVRPRIGIFRVELAPLVGKPGVHLRETSPGGKSFFLAASKETVDIEPGRFLLGTVYPIGRGEVLLGDGIIDAQGPDDGTAPTTPGRPEDFGPGLEEAMFGANVHWIEHATPREAREAYEEFRDALAATGDHLPGYLNFQALIGRSAMPLDIFRNGLSVEWWTETELGVMMAFLMRIWNLTPRPELGGRSPDEMANVRPRRNN